MNAPAGLAAPSSTPRVRRLLRERLFAVVMRHNGLRQRREELLDQLADVHDALKSAAREEEALRREVAWHQAREAK